MLGVEAAHTVGAEAERLLLSEVAVAVETGMKLANLLLLFFS